MAIFLGDGANGKEFIPMLSLSEVGSRTAESPTAPPHGWHRGRLADERRRMSLGWWKTLRKDRLLMVFERKPVFSLMLVLIFFEVS